MSITIEGRSLRLRARYGQLLNTWTLDILDNSTAEVLPLVMGVPIVMGADLVKPYRLEIGSLYAEANARPRDDAGRGELGNRINLVHYAPGEAIP
jgi:hypothetical protein